MNVYSHVRLHIQKGRAESRSTWHTERAADQQRGAGRKACCAAEGLVSTTHIVRLQAPAKITSEHRTERSLAFCCMQLDPVLGPVACRGWRSGGQA